MTTTDASAVTLAALASATRQRDEIDARSRALIREARAAGHSFAKIAEATGLTARGVKFICDDEAQAAHRDTVAAARDELRRLG